MSMKKIAVVLAVAAATLTLTACQTQQVTSKAALHNNQDLYEVMHEGRHYVFDDYAVYQEFLKVGETSYRKVFIGEGPKGQTLVFGLRSEDKKKLTGLAGVDMFQGKLAAAQDFYGEMRRDDGRLYVFNTLQDMQDVRNVGEAAYRLTQIGTGPQGQTVVFVLNKSNKKDYPTALVERFKAVNSL